MDFNIDTILESKTPEEFLGKIDETSQLNLDAKFVMKDLGLTSRVFNHWISVGLVSNKYKVGDYRFKFSFIELLWFNIVKELREYGFPLEKIKLVYTSLMEPRPYFETLSNLSPRVKKHYIKQVESRLGEDYKGKKEILEFIEKKLYPPKNPTEKFNDLVIIPLQLMLANFLNDRGEYRLLIDSSGNTFVFVKNPRENEQFNDLLDELEFDNESYISISLLKFLKRFIQKKENWDFAKDNNFLNENELYILSLIREGKAKSITIKFAGQKPTKIEITEEKKLFSESRLSETILKRHYQEIVIKTQDGNIAYANITTKMNLK